MVPLGLNRLTMFEVYARSLGIDPSVNLFRVFYRLGKQGEWFTFVKRTGRGSEKAILLEPFLV